MKSKLLLTMLALVCLFTATAQKELLNLTFTAVNDDEYVQLDSIRVINRTQGKDTLLVWPDTTVSLEVLQYDGMLYVGYAQGFAVGVQQGKRDNTSFHLFPCVPNPVENEAQVSLNMPRQGMVELQVRDLQGKEVLSLKQNLEEGHHLFRFVPGDGHLFFLTAKWNGLSQTIKIMATGRNNPSGCSLTQNGMSRTHSLEKSGEGVRSLVSLESGILDTAGVSGIQRFQFANNIPCPGTPTITYEGQVYQTIQVGSQCWLKENLNVGTMIPGTQQQTGTGAHLEKYCFDNDPDNCAKYGGLYQWNEMMQFYMPGMYQGICPQGWHIPSDEEWMVLEGSADSEYGIGDSIWENISARGLDAAFNLKSSVGWPEGGNGNDLYGFSALPGGQRDNNGNFLSVGIYAVWWTSRQTFASYGVSRLFNAHNNNPIRNLSDYLGNGNSVRCLKDD